MSERAGRPWVLGLDGGGTRTRMAVVSRDGELVAWRESGGTNFRTVGWEGVRRSLEDLGRDWQVDVAMMGVAGAADDSTRARIGEIAVELGWTGVDRVVVDHDLRVAWAGGLAGRPGVIAIAGTGAACFGVGVDGRTWRAGGWSWETDQHGGGYGIARAAQAAVWRARDGRGRATGLVEVLPEPQTWEKLSRADTARLARVVVELAEQGDEVAADLVRGQARELAEATGAVAGKLGLESGPISYAGSWLERSEFYRAEFVRAVEDRLPGVVVEPPRWPPVVGAVWLAMRRAGWTVEEAVLDRLAARCGRKVLTVAPGVV